MLWPYRSRAPLPPHEHCCHRHHRHCHHHGHRHHHHSHHNHHSHTHQAPAPARGPRGRGVAEYSSPSRCRGLIFENAPPRHARPSPRPSGPQTRLVLRAQVRLLPGWSWLGCGKGCVTPGKRPKASEPRPLPLRRARGEQRRRPTRERVSHRQPAPRFPARPRRQPGRGRRAQSRASGAMTWPDVACELGGSRCRARSPRPDGDQGVTAKPQTAARRAEGAAPRPVPGGLGTPRPQGQASAQGRGIWALGAGARVLGQDGGLLLTGTQPPGGTCGPPTGHIDLPWPASGCGVRSIIGRHRRAHRAGCTGSPGWAWRWLLGRRRPWLHLLRPKPLPRGLDAGSRGWGTAASAFAHSRTSVATGPGSDPHLHTRPSPQAGDRLRQGSSWHTLPPRRPAPHGPKPHREQHAGPGGRECEAGEHTEGPPPAP